MPTVNDIPEWQVPAWLGDDQRHYPPPAGQPYCWSLAAAHTRRTSGREIWLWVAVNGEWIAEPVSMRDCLPVNYIVRNVVRGDLQVIEDIDRAISWLRAGNAPADAPMVRTVSGGDYHSLGEGGVEAAERNMLETMRRDPEYPHPRVRRHPTDVAMLNEETYDDGLDSEDEEEERSEESAAERMQRNVGMAFTDAGRAEIFFCSIHGRVPIHVSLIISTGTPSVRRYCGLCVIDGLQRLGVQELSTSPVGAEYTPPQPVPERKKYEIKRRKIRTRRSK
jgi:hypothetical protein